jgi:HEAT repeats
MVLDYMDKGFLDNIIDMFKHDETLFPMLVDMVKDERLRVRLGATALVEEFVHVNPALLAPLVPGLAALLKDGNPTVRGDSANLLGIIGHPDALRSLKEAEDDENREVREIVREAIADISSAQAASQSRGG